MKAKVVLADFQFLTRKGITALIQAIPGLELVQLVDRETDLADVIKSVKPELAVVDVHGKEDVLLPQIASLKGVVSTSLLVISNSQNRESIQQLLDSGVKGILTKNCSEEEITNGMIAVAKGNRFFCNTVLEMMVQGESDEIDCEPTNLSRREYQVIERITRGMTTAQIAADLHLSVHTINSHRKNILKKLKLGSPAELIVYALESGLVRS